MQAITFRSIGGLEVVETIERPNPIPGTGEVVVGVSYAALNPADIAQREGRYPAPDGIVADIAGIEVSGKILACGPNVERFDKGDRVFGLVGGGGLADRVLVPECLLTEVPTSLTDRDASAVPESFITAHDALLSKGCLVPTDRVLVIGGNGGVGAAASQLAAALGASVVASARSAAGLRFIESLGVEALAQEDLHSSGTPEGSGFDLIIDLVGGPNIVRSIEILNAGGRLVLVGLAAGSQVSLDVRPLLLKALTVVGTTLRNRALPEKAVAVQRFEKDVVPLLDRAVIRPTIDAVFSSLAPQDAFRHLASSGKQGKVLVAFG